METVFNLTSTIFITILTSSVGFVVRTMLIDQPLTVAFMVIGIAIVAICLLGFIKWRLKL